GQAGFINGFEPSPRVLPDFEGVLGSFETQNSYNMIIRVHPQNPDLVFTGGTNLYRTTDGFRSVANISWVGGYNPEGGFSVYPNHHPDQHEVLFYPSDPNKILSANDGGLRVTQDGTQEEVVWESLNNGYVTSQFFTVAQTKEAGSITVLGGMQDNGTDISTGSGFSEWSGLIGGDGSYAATTPGQELWFSSFQRAQTLRLTLNQNREITSFARIDPASLVASRGNIFLFINPFIVDPLNSNRVFMAGGRDLYIHENVSQIPGGSQNIVSIGWKRLNLQKSLDGQISSITSSEDGRTVYYGSTVGELRRLDNANDPLAFELDSLQDSSLPPGFVSCISVDPSDNSHIIVVFSNYNIPSIFESFNGGQTFQNISGNLEENPDGSGAGFSIRWAEIVPLASGYRVFAGTSSGLYSTEETSFTTTWTQESLDGIGNAVVTMMDYRPIDGRLVIATHGNGIFETFIEDFDRVIADRPIEEAAALIAAYPNPFNNSTEIAFNIPENEEIRVDIFSSKGEFINTILWANLFAGENRVTWDGTNAAGVSLPNGVYLYDLSGSLGTHFTGRLIIDR
ncbi:MAG: FlgD immunoglobulin-like domain containing protein, partial [Bacteroidota bacterium]